MNPKQTIGIALCAFVFLYVEASQAGLVRNTGRSTLSRVYSTQIYHIEDRYLNAVGIAEEYMVGGPVPRADIIRSQGSINGDSNPIGAFPAGVDGCYRGYEQREFDELRERSDNGTATQGDLDRLNEITAVDPCIWEFEEGDMVSTFGFFGVGMFGSGLGLDDLVSYDVDWVIDGITYDGEINRGDPIVTADGTIQRGSIFLNADIDLAPGEYDIFTRVTLSSDVGRFFAFSSENPDDSIGFSGFGEICEDNPDYAAFDEYVTNNGGSADGWVGDIPDPDICGHKNVYTDRSGSPSFDFDQTPSYRSETELLRIKASTTSGPDGVVSAPATMTLLTLGLFGAGWTRRKKKVSEKLTA